MLELTVGQLAQAVKGRVTRGTMASRLLRGVCDLEHASASDLSFCASARYQSLLHATHAGAVLVSQALCDGLEDALPDGTFIVCEDPYLALARACSLFAPKREADGTRHGSALVHPTAQVASTASLGAFVVIEANAVVGEHCVVGTHAFVGKNATLGSHTHIGVGAKVLWGCALGSRVTVQPGAIIGSDGFGFAVDSDSGKRYPIPQLGNVLVEDDVDIGSNSCIDRATFGSTVLGRGSKIDNLVQVAHNCRLGQDCVMTAQTGVAGSTTLGDRVLVGAQAGIAGHAIIANDVQLAARSGVPSSIRQAGQYGGTPTQSLSDWRRSMVALRRLPEAFKRLARLEAQLSRPAERPEEEPS